jgi:hypothetical protein
MIENMDCIEIKETITTDELYKRYSQKTWLEWVEPFGKDNGPVYMRVSPKTAISHIKQIHPELSDEQALNEFIVVYWANVVYSK